MLLQLWFSADQTLNASSKHTCTRIQPIVRMTLLRYLLHFLRSFGKGFLWYSVASQVDKAVHQFLSNGYSLQNMPLICTVILRLEVTRDAKCMKVSMDEYVNCLPAMEKWLFNAGHVDVVPQERKVFAFTHEEMKIFSAWENV